MNTIPNGCPLLSAFWHIWPTLGKSHRHSMQQHTHTLSHTHKHTYTHIKGLRHMVLHMGAILLCVWNYILVMTLDGNVKPQMQESLGNSAENSRVFHTTIYEKLCLRSVLQRHCLLHAIYISFWHCSTNDPNIGHYLINHNYFPASSSLYLAIQCLYPFLPWFQNLFFLGF